MNDHTSGGIPEGDAAPQSWFARWIFPHLPNALTTLRIVFAAVILIIWFDEEFFGLESLRFLLILLLYLGSAITDYLDGYLARSTAQVSTFGASYDPFADKIFTLTIFIAYLFYPLTVVSPWWVILIFIREGGITGLRIFSKRIGFVVASDPHGKLKTFIQMSVQLIIFAFLLSLAILYDSHVFQLFLQANFAEITALTSSSVAFLDLPQEVWQAYFEEELHLPAFFAKRYDQLPNLLVLIAMVFTMTSGFQYIRTLLRSRSQKN